MKNNTKYFLFGLSLLCVCMIGITTIKGSILNPLRTAVGYVLVPKQTTDAVSVSAAVAGAGRSLGYVNAPSLFQQVTAECCDLTSDISVYERNCTLLTDALREMGYHVVQPGGAFYLFPRSLEPDDMAFSERAKQFDLLLVPGSGFGVPGHFRIAYCVQTEMIQRALPRFKALADSYKK